VATRQRWIAAFGRVVSRDRLVGPSESNPPPRPRSRRDGEFLPVSTIDARDPRKALRRIRHLFHGVLSYLEATIGHRRFEGQDGECVVRNREWSMPSVLHFCGGIERWRPRNAWRKSQFPIRADGS